MTVHLADTVDHAVDLLTASPSATLLAGGTDLMVEVNEGHRRPAGPVVVVNRIPELRSWRHDPDQATVTIGAAVPYTEMLDGPLASLVPALSQAARTVGSPQIRNAGTLGGNLGTCSPAGDGLPVLSALDAEVELASAAGRRRLPIGEFMVGVKQTALRPGELIVSVTVPVIVGFQGYAKVGVRNAMVISVASACVVIDRVGQTTAVALGSVGPTVLRCPEAETHLGVALDWPTLDIAEPALDRFAELVAAASRPITDHRSSAGDGDHYVLHVNGVRREVTDSWLGESLLDVLRDRLGLLGAKGACEQGECGSCSVLVDDVLVCSCLVMAASAVDQPIVTIEGVADSPSDVQQAFVDAGAVQCGFCTPGLIMATHDLLERIPQPTETQIREELAGNVCRCTGYGRIIDAVHRVAVARSEAS